MTDARRALWWFGWPVRMGLVGLIGLYRVTLGQVIGGSCRFYPSCSAYAEMAIRERGAMRGVALAAWRIVRCSPLSKGGVEYPPGHGGHPVVYDAIIPPAGVSASSRGGTSAA